MISLKLWMAWVCMCYQNIPDSFQGAINKQPYRLKGISACTIDSRIRFQPFRTLIMLTPPSPPPPQKKERQNGYIVFVSTFSILSVFTSTNATLTSFGYGGWG